MNQTTPTLNDLIEALKDGQAGFRSAAEAVTSTELKALFHEYAQQRSQFAGELQTLARTLGEPEPETEGSTAGALHRGWIDLKSALTNRDDHAILAECERGEDSAVAAYRKALEEDGLPANVLEIIRTQSTKVKAAHDRVRNLRDSMAK